MPIADSHAVTIRQREDAAAIYCERSCSLAGAAWRAYRLPWNAGRNRFNVMNVSVTKKEYDICLRWTSSWQHWRRWFPWNSNATCNSMLADSRPMRHRGKRSVSTLRLDAA